MKQDIRFIGRTKENTDWETWWCLVIEVYQYGFYDAPMFGGDPDVVYKWFTPTEQNVKDFVSDERVKALYKRCYEAGDDPHYAFEAMY